MAMKPSINVRTNFANDFMKYTVAVSVNIMLAIQNKLLFARH